jgi:hypothetical protein
MTMHMQSAWENLEPHLSKVISIKIQSFISLKVTWLWSPSPSAFLCLRTFFAPSPHLANAHLSFSLDIHFTSSKELFLIDLSDSLNLVHLP